MIRTETPDRSKVQYQLDGKDLLDLFAKHIAPRPPNPLIPGGYKIDIKVEDGYLVFTCTKGPAQ